MGVLFWNAAARGSGPGETHPCQRVRVDPGWSGRAPAAGCRCRVLNCGDQRLGDVRDGALVGIIGVSTNLGCRCGRCWNGRPTPRWCCARTAWWPTPAPRHRLPRWSTRLAEENRHMREVN